MSTPKRNAIYDATIRRMTSQTLEAAERLFAQTHADDTEEQLVGYLQECAASLGVHAFATRDFGRRDDTIALGHLGKSFGESRSAAS